MIIPLFLFDDRSIAQQRVALNLSEEFKSIRRCRGNRGGERRRLRAPVPVWATACIYASEINNDIDKTKDNSKSLASSVLSIEFTLIRSSTERNPYEASSRGVGEWRGFNHAE
jgi:hypothetical protein